MTLGIMPMALVVAYLSAATFVVLRYFRASKLHLPPGPKGIPIFGNIFDIPKDASWIMYKKLGDQYSSGIIHLNMLGTPLIVINSRTIAEDLFEKRSMIYSDRPRMPMINELVGFSWHFAFMRYGDEWKEHRKLFHQEFQPPASLAHRAHIVSAARTLLYRFLENPTNGFLQQLRHMTGAIILGATYGIEVQEKNDPYVQVSEKSLHAMAETGNSGSYLVDSIPALKHLPRWFPGANFQREAEEWHRIVTAMPILPFEFVKRSIANGTARSSVASRNLELLQDPENSRHEEEVLRNTLGAIYAAGADTTVSALGTFILAMVQNSDIQKKGQAAVDAIVGGNRLPDFSDLDSIPYVDAITKEVLRWRPVTPLAVPHAVTVDDIYEGYHIPAGSIVVGNSWAMLNDEATYGEMTSLFRPERFLKDGVLNSSVKHPDEAFGFGRRQCPGQEMAYSTVWIAIASILASFDILKGVDDNGAVVEPSGEYSSGLLCYPSPFPCVFRPRSREAKALILSEILAA